MRLLNLVRMSLGFLAFMSAMNYAAAQDVGVIAVNGMEKVKVSRCGSTSNQYLYSFFVHGDGTWDYYDESLDLLLPAAGTYVGTPQSRKMNLAAGSLLTTAFVSVMQDYAESMCGTSLNVLSNTPVVYKVKINKNLTVSKVKSKFTVRGYSPAYGRSGNAKYTFAGAGTYNIESM